MLLLISSDGIIKAKFIRFHMKSFFCTKLANWCQKSTLG